MVLSRGGYILLVLLLACGLALTSCDQDGEIKEIASHSLGREPSDSEIRSACSSLRSQGYDYYAAGMSTGLSQGSRVTIMAAIVTVAGSGTKDYCEGKLKENANN